MLDQKRLSERRGMRLAKPAAVPAKRPVNSPFRNRLRASGQSLGPVALTGLLVAGILILAGHEVTARAAGCTVKGNISVVGERIYHVPGQEHYDRMRVDWLQGDRWFCSEEAAREAGWRKSKV